MDNIRLGLGTWNFCGLQKLTGKTLGWPPIKDSCKINILEAFLDAGGRFIDTSDFYANGEVEKFLGSFFKANGQIVFATKGGLLPLYDVYKKEIERNFSSNYIKSAIEASRTRLQRDKIYLYQLHGPGVENLQDSELWETLQKSVDVGKIQHVGISLRKRMLKPDIFKLIIQNPLIYSVQLPIDISSKHSIDLVSLLRKGGKKIIGRSPFKHGLFFRMKESDLQKDDPRLDFVKTTTFEEINNFRKNIERFADQVDVKPAAFFLDAILNSGLYDTIFFGASQPYQVLQNFRLGIKHSFKYEGLLMDFLRMCSNKAVST